MMLKPKSFAVKWGCNSTPTPLRSEIAGGNMLTTWVLVAMLEGKPIEAVQSDSEAHCKESMEKWLRALGESGKSATAACYVRATDIDDTKRQRVGSLIESR